MIKRFTDPAFYDFFDWRKSLLLGLFLVVLEWLYLQYALNYNSLQPGDALDYWNDSLNWKRPYDSYHVPGYAFALAAMRGVAGSVLDPGGILLVTTLLAFSVTLVTVHHLAGLGHRLNRNALGFMAVAIFVLWPLVGTTYVAYPIADMFGIAPFVLGLWLLVRKQSVYGGLFLGLALISHKAIWPFAGLILVAHLLSMRTTKSLAAVGVAAIPLGILWLLGSLHYNSAAWLYSKNLSWEIESTSALPLLDGLVGSIIFGGVSGILKGVIVLALAAVTLAAAVRAWRLPRSDETKWYCLAIFGAVLALIVVLNEREIWASVRFGRLIAIPLVWIYGNTFLTSLRKFRTIGYVAAWSVIGMFGSQFAFGYYMAKIWQFSGIFPTER